MPNTCVCARVANLYTIIQILFSIMMCIKVTSKCLRQCVHWSFKYGHLRKLIMKGVFWSARVTWNGSSNRSIGALSSQGLIFGSFYWCRIWLSFQYINIYSDICNLVCVQMRLNMIWDWWHMYNLRHWTNL